MNRYREIPPLPKPVRPVALWTALVVAGAAAVMTTPALASADEGVPPENVVVYLIDHQYLTDEERNGVVSEVSRIFGTAGIEIDWQIDRSPRRLLDPNELRLLLLPSDGTRWFHGPSNVIGLAPHDERGIGRNCFVFYRQALWFRQQAALRCREANRARQLAAVRGAEVDPGLDALAPAECSDYLDDLTPLIVARAAAHEIVHILLDKLDHTTKGLMRDSFQIEEWLREDSLEYFILGPDEVAGLQALIGGTSGAGETAGSR